MLVPPAARWTTGQLRARLLRMVLEVDPGYAERRYRAAVRGRGVVGYLDRDGVGTVTGFGLPAQDAVAACERLDALAEAVRRAGHPDTLPQIRADLFTRLLDGRFQAMTGEQMIAAMLAETAAHPQEQETAAQAEDAAAQPQETQAEEETAAQPEETQEAATGVEVATEVPAADEPITLMPAAAASDLDATSTGGSATDVPVGGSPAGGGSSCITVAGTPSAAVTSTEDAADQDAAAEDAADQVATGNTSAGGASVSGVGGADRDRPGGEIRVGLGTLLHLDERCGEVPGWGPVLAEVTRLMVAQRRGAQWRFAVTDPDGYLIFAGVTRRRPATVHPDRGGVVELHVPATLLGELARDAETAGEWAGVVADLARQFADRDQHQQALARHRGDRFARAALRRHVQVRDRRCIAPGCRRPARRCELDHTLDHALGGDTVPENSGPLCLRHHLMKHQGGWRLDQPEPGLFRWTSPLGQVYWTRGEPICPPPGPVHPRPMEPAWWWDPTQTIDGPTMHHPPPPEPEPPPTPPPAADDDEPPF